MDYGIVNSIWMLVCVGLVFGMQAGFLCLESGLTRSKNAISVGIKNLTDFSVSFLLFWAFGFALMFGATQYGWIGATHYLAPLGQSSLPFTTFFLFQAMFCATAATIVSGAVAERITFSAYLVLAIIVSGLIYPVFGHWAWGGALDGGRGWLAELGFVDFAGATVVHGVGAWSAFAAVLAIGPRAGRFNAEAEPRLISGSNLPLAMLGTLLLWMGWIGFNGGSMLAMNDRVGCIVCNTFLSGAAGMTTALVVGWFIKKRADVRLAINGSLAGLVAVTAGCHAVTSPSAVIIGAVGAVVMMNAQWIFDRCQIDDAVGAFPVHGAAGAWGTIAVALFGSPAILGTGLSRAEQLGVQLAGIAVAAVTTFATTYLLLKLVSRVVRLRVTEDEERVGLNVTEHGASTELFDLLTEMEEQARSRNFSTRVTVEPGSDVGIIAAQYNRVLTKIAESESQRDQVNQELIQTSRKAAMAEVATGLLHNVSNVLNSINVSASTVMEKLRASRVKSLSKAAEVIRERQGDLATFLTADERGKQFPGLLAALATNLSDERDAQFEELQSLIDNIEHVKEIVDSQQSRARSVAAIESVDLIELVENALRINNDRMIPASVNVVREFDATPPVTANKHKVLQILVNLIGNAQQSLCECDRVDKTLTVGISPYEDDLQVQVRDNGVGIAPENLVKVFSHGFTTKQDGHGFGLHSCALAAQELGGSLSAHSDGPGRGALFTLRLPVGRETPCTV